MVNVVQWTWSRGPRWPAADCCSRIVTGGATVDGRCADVRAEVGTRTVRPVTRVSSAGRAATWLVHRHSYASFAVHSDGDPCGAGGGRHHPGAMTTFDWGSSPAVRAMMVHAHTRHSAVRAGFSDDQVSRMCRAGYWVRLARGVYVERAAFDGLGAVDQFLARALALASTQSRPTAMSHVGAAALFGLPVPRPFVSRGRHHLMQLEPRSARSTATCTWHERWSADAVATVVPVPWAPAAGSQVLVVSAALAAIGVAEICGHTAGVIAMDAALQRGYAGRAELEGLMRESSPRRPRRRIALRAVRDCDAGAESPLETMVRLLLIRWGYRVATQVVIRTPGGDFVGRVDLLLEDLGVVVEVDGRVKYAGRDATAVLLAEKRRESALTDLGYGVVRLEEADLRRPAEVMARIVAAADRSARQRGLVGTATPAGRALPTALTRAGAG